MVTELEIFFEPIVDRPIGSDQVQDHENQARHREKKQNAQGHGEPEPRQELENMGHAIFV